MISRLSIRKLAIIGAVLGGLIYVVRNRRTSLVGGNPIIEDLGTLGGEFSSGSGINNFGSVTGTSSLRGDPVRSHAFRYVDSLGMIDVGSPSPGGHSLGMKINNSGLVCGGFLTLPNYFESAFIADAAQNLTVLDDAGITSPWAWDVNDRGQVVGNAREVHSEGHELNWALIWTSAVDRQALGTLGGKFSVGHAINKNGQVAGHSTTADDVTRLAFRYSPGVGMISLGTLGGARSAAYGINDAGQVVGESETAEVLNGKFFLLGGATEPPLHAFLWTEGEGMIDLGALSGSPSIFGGGRSIAKAINNKGVVVGYSTLGPHSTTKHAFRWTREEGMIDLNTLLPDGSGWVLSDAEDINDKGAITGTGLHNGQRRAYRMFHRFVIVEP